jgi:hypothetical protein
MAHAVEYDSPLRAGTRNVRNEAFAADLLVLCLWSAAGLAVTAAFFVAGFADELTRALAAG